MRTKQYKEIMTTIKKKVNIFKNKLQKTKQKKFSQNKVPDNQEIGKKNRRYSQEKRKSKIRQNKKERKIRKKKELAEIKKKKKKKNYRIKTLSTQQILNLISISSLY